MIDIEAGKIDTVVVYKIDRLTRSLPDFAKLVEVFDRNGVSFVAVAQQFNTTTSMGRLTLNILLSFAQFEREVTGERIRDKIAASKAKGMWMGGVPPPDTTWSSASSSSTTVAALVRDIFRRYAEHGRRRDSSANWISKGIPPSVGRKPAGRDWGAPSTSSTFLPCCATASTSAKSAINGRGTKASTTPSFHRRCGTRMPSSNESRLRANTPPSIRHCWRDCCSRRMANACCTLRQEENGRQYRYYVPTCTSGATQVRACRPHTRTSVICQPPKSRTRCWHKSMQALHRRKC